MHGLSVMLGEHNTTPGSMKTCGLNPQLLQIDSNKQIRKGMLSSLLAVVEPPVSLSDFGALARQNRTD